MQHKPKIKWCEQLLQRLLGRTEHCCYYHDMKKTHHLQLKCSNKPIKHVKVMWTEYRHILDRYEFSWPQCESLPKWCTQEVFSISLGKC
jgi:hypothetical protein